jgi:protein phosphatase
MGGHVAGEIASSIAATSLTNHLKGRCDYPGEKLETAIQLASLQILAHQENHPEHHGMATTATVLWVPSNWAPRAWIGHVGDSRVYLLRDSKFERLTEDHSWTFVLYKEGCLTKEQARVHPRRNFVTRSLGHHPCIEPDILSFEVAEGDRVLLCTDGLSNLVSDQEICSIVSGNSLDEGSDLLVARANGNGGSDNISLVLLEVTRVFS